MKFNITDAPVQQYTGWVTDAKESKAEEKKEKAKKKKEKKEKK